MSICNFYSIKIYFFLLNLPNFSQSPEAGEEIYTEKEMEKLEKLMNFGWAENNIIFGKMEKYLGKMEPAGNYFVVLWEKFEEAKENSKSEKMKIGDLKRTKCDPREFALLARIGSKLTKRTLEFMRLKDSESFFGRFFKQFIWTETNENGEFEFIYRRGKKTGRMEISNFFEFSENLKISILPNIQHQALMPDTFLPAQMLILKGFKNSTVQNAGENVEIIEFEESEDDLEEILKNCVEKGAADSIYLGAYLQEIGPRILNGMKERMDEKWRKILIKFGKCLENRGNIFGEEKLIGEICQILEQNSEIKKDENFDGWRKICEENERRFGRGKQIEKGTGEKWWETGGESSSKNGIKLAKSISRKSLPELGRRENEGGNTSPKKKSPKTEANQPNEDWSRQRKFRWTLH